MSNQSPKNLANALQSNDNDEDPSELNSQLENNTNNNTSLSEKNSKNDDEDPENDENTTKNVSIIGKGAEAINNTNTNTNTNNKTKRRNMNPNSTNLTKKNNITNNTANKNATRNNNPNEQPVSEEDKDNEANTTSEDVPDTANENITEIRENNTSNTKNKEKMIQLNKLTMNLLNHQIIMKLFHFQTTMYGAHKASDSYLSKFADTMDRFLEIAQGIYGKVTLKKYTLTGSAHTDENIVNHLEGMITLLREKINDILANYTDLINIRDELVGDIEQLKYLLTFK